MRSEADVARMLADSLELSACPGARDAIERLDELADFVAGKLRREAMDEEAKAQWSAFALALREVTDAIRHHG